MMAGNWAQHAFVDPASPANNYRNSITCINCSYNRRCFNDGYHIGHHLKSTRHWTEMPEEFARNVRIYEREGALVFSGIDFFGVWLCLMTKRYDVLARRVVSLGESSEHGRAGASSEEASEIVKVMKGRARWTKPRALPVDTMAAQMR
jgi:hypothetical protein